MQIYQGITEGKYSFCPQAKLSLNRFPILQIIERTLAFVRMSMIAFSSVNLHNLEISVRIWQVILLQGKQMAVRCPRLAGVRISQVI